jgi:hypothetical protein
MTWRIVSAVALGCATLTFGMSAAKACTPVPPPDRAVGEGDAEYAARTREWEASRELARQRQSWDRATTVMLVEIQRVAPFGDRRSELTSTWVSTVAPLKGTRAPLPFRFKPVGACIPEDTVASGRLRDTLVLFFDSPTPDKKALIDALPPASITEPRILAALANAK